MHEECEKHNLIGCAICHKTTYEVKTDTMRAADKAAQEAKKAQRAAKRAERQARRELPKEDRALLQSTTDRKRNPYQGYTTPKEVQSGQWGLRPHRGQEGFVEQTPQIAQTAETGQSTRIASNYWGWAILDNSL